MMSSQNIRGTQIALLKERDKMQTCAFIMQINCRTPKRMAQRTQVALKLQKTVKGTANTNCSDVRF